MSPPAAPPATRGGTDRRHALRRGGEWQRPPRRSLTLGFDSPATKPPPAWPGRRPGSTDRRTCARHHRMPTRAACTGSEVPVPEPQRARGTARPYSPATSSRPIALPTHWTPSPCRRLSRPPWWRVTATTTTGPPPRPGGNSGRCACPKPQGFGGHHRDASHVHHRPVGRIGAQLYPGGIAARYRNIARDLDRPNNKRSTKTGPEQKPGPEHPKQPIAASFGAARGSRGF